MRFILTLALALLVGCTAPERSEEVLQQHGFTEITTGGYAWWGCGDDDTYHTKFTATNSQGMRVSGVVCCGQWKNCTVRF
jgi:hypothetical protein